MKKETAKNWAKKYSSVIKGDEAAYGIPRAVGDVITFTEDEPSEISFTTAKGEERSYLGMATDAGPVSFSQVSRTGCGISYESTLKGDRLEDFLNMLPLTLRIKSIRKNSFDQNIYIWEKVEEEE